jgi:4-amino-4-deoxy-L-arabinose transferase-like glycosyltransferase
MRFPGVTRNCSRLLALLAILILLCGYLFFIRLADRDLWSSHEGRAGQNAQSILDDGNWALPHLFDGSVELQKPPLYYWLVAVATWLRGADVDAWSVRIPAALAAASTVLWLFLFGLIRRRPEAGFLAAVLLATMVHYTWLARVGRIDMVLTFVVSLALAFLYMSRQTESAAGRNARLCLGYLFLGLALLLKGPIGALLILAVAGAFLLCE